MKRVLLVTAFAPLRSIAAMVLRRADYEVDEAWNEAMALAFLAQRVGEYAVLVAGLDDGDVQGPGERAVNAARTSYPSLPIIAWSEKSPAAMTPRLVWLRRPWAPAELVETVKRTARP